MSTPSKNPGTKLIGSNKNARRNYEILDTFEAGISLMGSEVKSLRQGRVSFKDGYVKITAGEAWLVGVHIAPYEYATHFGHEPERERRLLLHKHEIEMLASKVEQKGLSVVPTKMYFRKGRVKVEVALCRGKKIHDRRDDIKQRDIARDTARELARY